MGDQIAYVLASLLGTIPWLALAYVANKAVNDFAPILIDRWDCDRDRLKEDVELVCDTVFRAVAAASGNGMMAPHERLMPEEVEPAPAIDWSKEEVDPIPSVEEIEDTIRKSGGNARHAIFIMMERRGMDPNNDVHIERWKEMVDSA